MLLKEYPCILEFRRSSFLSIGHTSRYQYLLVHIIMLVHLLITLYVSTSSPYLSELLLLSDMASKSVIAKKGRVMSEQKNAIGQERWPLLEAINWIEMLSYLGRSPLAERQITDEIEWVVTGVVGNRFYGV